MDDNLNDASWMEEGTIDEATEIESGVIDYDITASPNDFNVSTLISFIEGGSIEIPPYQRNYTWDMRRASRLIESLVLGLPVPQLFLYQKEKNKFAILDGQQRLMSIYFFVKKRFPLKEKRAELREIFSNHGLFPQEILSENKYFREFNLSFPSPDGEVRSPLHGLNYDTLGEYRMPFDMRTVRCVIIKQNEPDDDHSSVYEIFDRLNTGGVNLKPQELRSNLYYSDFYAKIYEINKYPLWRSIIGQPQQDVNLRDVELILRAFAMLETSDDYKPSMVRFLNRYSDKKKRDHQNADLLETIFLKFIGQFSGDRARIFTPAQTNKFSIGLFESIFTATCTAALASGNPDDITAASDEQITEVEDRIRPLLQVGSSRRENVVGRLSAARTVILNDE